MENFLLLTLSGFPYFISHFVLAVVLLWVFKFVYVKLTPYDEIELIRQGNPAAATSLGGALLGFSIPLAQSAAQSVDLLDMLIWATIAMLVQLLAFGVVRLIVPQIAKDIPEGKVAQGIYLAVMSIAMGLLNAACMNE